jgi:hypothetical protein
MRMAALVLAGLFVGGLAGGILGVAAGLVWTTFFHTTSFEGYSGMLVFLTFMPIGLIVGAIVGTAGFAFTGTRAPRPPP